MPYYNVSTYMWVWSFPGSSVSLNFKLADRVCAVPVPVSEIPSRVKVFSLLMCNGNNVS